MLAIIATLFAVPSSQASSSGATVPTSPGRVTAAVASESSGAGLSRAFIHGHATEVASSQGHAKTLAAPDSSRHLQVTQRLRHGVQERRSAAWKHADWLGQARAKTVYRERHTRSLPYLRWLKARWNTRAHLLWRLTLVTLRDFEVDAGSNAWLRAVEEAQKAYPGTASWLVFCSASEGGHGRWVPNSQGSGVGGWMQMFPSTFWRMFGAARADVEARGFRVPASAASWYSPLGQALGSAWGLTHGRRGEWAGAGC